MDCSLPVSSVHGIFQARILEWVAIPFSRGSCQRRDHTQVWLWYCRQIMIKRHSQVTSNEFSYWTDHHQEEWFSKKARYSFHLPWIKQKKCTPPHNKDRHINQWSRTGSPETYRHMYGHLIFYKNAKTILLQGERQSFQQIMLGNCISKLLLTVLCVHTCVKWISFEKQTLVFWAHQIS